MHFFSKKKPVGGVSLFGDSDVFAQAKKQITKQDKVHQLAFATILDLFKYMYCAKFLYIEAPAT